MKPSQLFEGKNSSLYKTFMNEIKGTYKGKPLEEMTKEELIENSQKDIKSGYLGEEGDDVLIYTTNQTKNRKCIVSPMYSKDDFKNLHFHCDYCGKEMGYEEDRECSFFNISSNNDIELREEWYEYLRSIIKNRDYIPEDAIDGAGDWWIKKIGDIKNNLVIKIKGYPNGHEWILKDDIINIININY